jgi:4-oxalocrotonate tautomerase
MPIVRIDLLEGRSREHKVELVRRVTEAVSTALDVQPGQVRVLVYEVPPEHWAVGGVSMAEQASDAADEELVEKDGASG